MFRNSHHAFQSFKNFSGCYTDPVLLKFFFDKSLHVWLYDPPQYNYWYISFWALGVAGFSVMRHFLFNPDVHFRRHEKKKNIIDRWQHHLYSLPFFNHHLRNVSQLFTGSFIDNEPDFVADHPWGIRPKRSQFYGRFPFVFSSPKYFVDCPSYNECRHNAVEKRYEALGYYPGRVGLSEREESNVEADETDELSAS